MDYVRRLNQKFGSVALTGLNENDIVVIHQN